MPDDALQEEQIAALLAQLPPAPEAWVDAAKQLPYARAQIESIVRRAAEDAAFRDRALLDLEAVLAAEGVEPTEALEAELARRLRDS
jgi:hypothetical protein